MKTKKKAIRTNDGKRTLDGFDLERKFNIEVREQEPAEGEEDSRTVEIAFSSDNDSLLRWFGYEVLEHKKDSVRLERLNNAAAVLVNHDTDDQVGVVERAWVDKDGKGRATVRFSRSARGTEIYNDVVDGIRQLVSVGYRVHAYEVEEKDGEPDVVRITDWEPFELSIVPVPFDSTVGVGRSAEGNTTINIYEGEHGMKHKLKKPLLEQETSVDDGGTRGSGGPTPTPTPDSVDTTAARKKGAKDERERQNAIREMAELNELDELGRQAIDEDWTVTRFNQEALKAIGEKNSAARGKKVNSQGQYDDKNGEYHDGNAGLSRKDVERYSLTRALAAMAFKDEPHVQKEAAFEREVSQAAIRGFGPDFNPRGLYVPPEVLEHRALAAGTANEAAELVATNLLAGSFIDVLRNASTMIRAGATMLPGLVGNVEIPRQTSGASMTWISTEDGDATESEPGFDQIVMNPKDAALYTEMTRRALMQSTPAIDGLIRRDMAQAVALGIDLATLYGSGSSGQPTGVANTTGINSKTFTAAAPTYAELVNMVKLLMDDNSLTGMPSWIIDPAGWEDAMTTPKQGSGVEGNFIMGSDGSILGYPSNVTNQVTAEDWFLGDWTQVLIGEWGGLEINVDPYTHSLKGRVRFVAFKTMDINVRRPTHFILGNDTP